MLNKGTTKLVAEGLVLVTIGGSCFYLGNSTQPPTYVKTVRVLQFILVDP